MRVPFSLHPLQYLLLSFLKIIFISILVDVQRHLIVVFICIFLRTDDIEHIFMLILAICICSLERCLFRSFAHFVIELFVIMYNFTCKYWKSCRFPGLNGIDFRHAAVQRVSYPFETAGHTELGSTPTSAGLAIVEWKVLQHHPRCDKTSRGSYCLGATLVFGQSRK